MARLRFVTAQIKEIENERLRRHEQVAAAFERVLAPLTDMNGGSRHSRDKCRYPDHKT